LKYKIEREEYHAVRDAVISLSTKVNSRVIAGENFDWKYRQSPLGDMAMWVDRHAETGRVIGSYGAYPRKFLFQGEVIVVYQRADSIVDQEYQGQGIFRALVAQMTRDLKNEGVHFHFGYSNDLSSRVHQKFTEAREMFESLVYVLPNGTATLSARVLSPRFRRVVTPFLPIISAVFKSRNHIKRLFQKASYQLVAAGDFTDIVVDWSRSNAKSYVYFPVRDYDFLRWKVFNTPADVMKNVRAWWLEKGNQKIGYVVTYEVPETGQVKIIDFLCNDLERTVVESIASIRNYFVEQGVDFISSNVAGRIHQDAFRKSRFMQSGKARCYLYILNETAVDPTSVTDGNFWYQMPIDRDNFSY